MIRPAAFLRNVWSQQFVEGKTNYFMLSTKKASTGKWRDHYLKWPISRDTLVEWLDTYSTDEYNLYFCPHGFVADEDGRPRRRKELATGTRFLWADLDEQDPARMKPKPQIAWESSPGRYAALWRLTKFHSGTSVEKFNKGLTYSGNADRGGWDFTQVLRIPGTKNHKYKKSPFGKLLWMDDSAYRIDDFPEFQETSDDPMELLKSLRLKIKGSTYRLLTASRATIGKRSEVIWRLENELTEQGLKPEEIFTLIKASVWNKFAGRRDEDKQLRREIGKSNGKHTRPSIAGGLKKANGHDVDDGRKIVNSGPILVRLSDVEREEIDWLWKPYIAIGKLTLIEGDPGLGKSWLTMALASHLSIKKKLPEQERAVKGRVLIMSAEDGLGDTIGPRLDQLGADSTKIVAIKGAVTFDEAGSEQIEEYIQRVRPILVIVDPLVYYMGGDVDLHKANETREIMTRMALLAEKYHTAFVCVRHLTKGGRDKSIYRGLGSIDLTASARSVIAIGRNPENPDDGRVMVHIKCNIAKVGQSIAYELMGSKSRPFRWRGVCEFSAEEVFKAEPSGGKGEFAQAVDFLKDELSDGEERSQTDLIREAESKGIPEKTLRSALREAGVRKVSRGGETLWSIAT